MASFLSFDSANQSLNYLRLCRAIVDVCTGILRDTLSRVITLSELKTKHAKSSEFNFKDLAIIDKSCKEEDYRYFDILLSYRSLKFVSQHKQRDALQENIRPSRILESVSNCKALSVNPFTKLTPNELSMVKHVVAVDSYEGINDHVLHKLYTNLCENNGNVLHPTKPWGQTPNLNDVTLGDDIERIRIMRNKIAHMPYMDISDAEFDEHWTDLDHIITRIDKCLKTNYKTALVQIKSEVIDDHSIKKYCDEIKNILDNEREVDVTLTDAQNDCKYETSLDMDLCPDSADQIKLILHNANRKVLKINGEAGQRNYFLVCQAVVFTGSSILRDLLQKELPPHSLSENADSIATRLKLNSLQKTLLNDADSNGYKNFEISLLYALLRYFCPSIQKPTMGWGNTAKQNVNYNSIGDDIERIRLVRNRVYKHLTELQISDTEFTSIWTELEGVTKRMDIRLHTNGKYYKELDNIQRCSSDQTDLHVVIQNEMHKWEMFGNIEKTKITDTTNTEHNLCVDGSPEITTPESILTSLSIHQKTPDGEPQFVDLGRRFTCLICNHVLRDAVQSMCGHRFCFMCAQSFFASSKLRCPANEEDCMEITITEIRPDISTRKEVRCLLVFCTYKNFGCSVKVQWKDLLSHQSECECRPVECSFRKLGCLDEIPFKFLETHVQNCKYVAVKCKYCQTEVAKIHMKEHEGNLCRKYPMQCLYNCGEEKLPREEMQIHMDTCSNKPKNCAYISVGCTFKGTRNELEEHQKKSTIYHINVVSAFASKLRGYVSHVQNDLQYLQTDVGDFSQERDIIKAMSNESMLETRSLKENVKNLKLKIVTQTEKLIGLEGKFGIYVAKSVLTNLSKDTKDMKDKFKKLEDKLVALDRTKRERQRPGIMSTSFEKTLEQIKSHESKIAIQDVQLSELDLRFQILETANYDGVLMWKIRDYKRRKQEAITGRTLSLYSQPFYSSRFGYKFCGRVYLNGDGPGKGTHLSFFFVVMRNEFDALLPWPFKQNVTLSVLDQQSRQRDIVESFYPEGGSGSFRRPTTEMNIATGCPELISHRELETDRYCKDDTIFLKLTVDTTGLVCPGKKVRP